MTLLIPKQTTRLQSCTWYMFFTIFFFLFFLTMDYPLQTERVKKVIDSWEVKIQLDNHTLVSSWNHNGNIWNVQLTGGILRGSWARPKEQCIFGRYQTFSFPSVINVTLSAEMNEAGRFAIINRLSNKRAQTLFIRF